MRGEAIQTGPFTIQTPRYQIGDVVTVKGKPEPRTVSAVYRVEIWFFYALQGLTGFLVEESRLNDENTNLLTQQETPLGTNSRSCVIPSGT